MFDVCFSPFPLFIVPLFPLCYFPMFLSLFLLFFFLYCWQPARYQLENMKLLHWVVRSSYMELVRRCYFSVVLSVTVVAVVTSR